MGYLSFGPKRARPTIPMNLVRLRIFVREQLRAGAEPIDDESLLFSTSVLDSFVLVDIIGFIEQETGRPMGPDDVTLENLDSISRILRLTGGVTGGVTIG